MFSKPTILPVDTEIHQWIQTDTRYRQIPVDTDRYNWIQTDTTGYRQIPVDTARYQWIQTDTTGYRQIPVDSYGNKWSYSTGNVLAIIAHFWYQRHVYYFVTRASKNAVLNFGDLYKNMCHWNFKNDLMWLRAYWQNF